MVNMENVHLGNLYLANSKPADGALIYQDQKVTYGELDQRVESYSNHLLKLGVKAGEVVALSCLNDLCF